MILKSLLRRRGRTILTTVGIAIGVAAIVALGATAGSVRAGVDSLVQGSDADLVVTQAGAMVFVFTALGAFVHPGFLALSAFVGAGLVFAGVTDTCGMGLVLTRMPWNRGSTTADAPAAGGGCAASAAGSEAPGAGAALG